MEKVKKWFKKNYDYFIPAGIILIILLFTFMVKGVYPFGNNGFALIDYIDGLVPSYTHLWDFLHGNSSFLFNETLGLGSNMYASSVLNTFFSPLSYLVGLSSREGIQYFVIYIIVFKMMLMGTTSYIIFKKWFKNVDKKFLCLFSLLWTFSSWLFVHVSNVGWLDVMILFPFLIDSLRDLLEKGKCKKFTILLTLCLVFSYYMSYMILVMMVVGLFSAIFTLVDKDNRKRVTGQLFVSILGALLLSMFAFLPSFMQSQASFRFSDDLDVDMTGPFYSKVSLLLFYGILLYLPFKLFKKDRSNKYTKFLMVFVGLMLLPVIVEPINKMWHTGSYSCYPFRYSFAPIFFLIIASLSYINKFHDEEEVKRKKYDMAFVYISSICMILGYTICIAGNIYISPQLCFLLPMSYGVLYAIVGISSLVLIHFLSKVVKSNYKKWVLIGVTGVQIVAYSVGYVGVSYTGVNNVYEYKNNFALEKLNKNYGIKDNTYTLMANFPLLMDHKSISTWLHINSENENKNAIALGYHTHVTQIYSYGGTIFSDMLSNTRYIYSLTELDNEIYNLLESHTIDISGDDTKVYLYEYKYNLPLGLIIDTEKEIKDLDMYDNPIDNQNYLYKTIFDKTDNLINVLIENGRAKEENTYNINVTGKELVYLYSDSDEIINAEIYVNDVKINENHGRGIIDLGSFENEEVVIKINNEEELNNIQIASIEFSDIISLSDSAYNDISVKFEGNKVIVNVNSNKVGKLYLPINHEDGSWTAVVNDKEVEVSRYLTAYLGTDIEQGDNEIILTFTPKMLDLGIKLTIITMILISILWIADRKFKLFAKKKFVNVMYWIGLVVFVAIGSYIYIIPLTK